MKVIYIAGPYRDTRGEYYIKQNIETAAQCALSVWLWGGVAICPHKNTEGWGGVTSDDTWLTGDLELVKRSDAVWAVKGWKLSTGAMIEIDAARAEGKTVLFSEHEVLDFLMRDKPYAHC